MNVSYLEIARRLSVAPLQVLVELAAMSQPPGDCWPECDEAFAETLRERRRVRMGLPPRAPAAYAGSAGPTVPKELPVSDAAAAILDKLLRKSYGLKSVRVFTMLQKWIHGASESDIRQLIQRGNLEWTDPASRTAVNLVANRLADTEQIVELYRQMERS